MNLGSNIKESQLATTLTELTSKGLLHWVIKTPASVSIKGRSFPSMLKYCYEARLGNNTLILYDESQNPIYPIGLGLPGLIGGGTYTLSIIDRDSGVEALAIGGRVLNDLYETVRSKTGDADSVLDGLLESAAKLKIEY